jgi:predicted metal-dependent peptidase
MSSKSPSTDIHSELSRCVNQLLLKEPFYAHILAGTVRKITEEVPTAAVGVNGKLLMLMVNEEFFLRSIRALPERVAVLKHEVLHLVFRHLFREKFKEDPELYNIAADIVVNQYIGSPWKLPDDAVTLENFSDLELESGRSVEYYYERLKNLSEQMDWNAPGNGKGEEESSKEGSGGKGNQPSSDPSGVPPKSAQSLRELYGKQRHSDHSFWVVKGFGDSCIANGIPIEKNSIVGIEQDLKRHLLDAFSRTPAKYYGNIPLDIMRQIEIIREEMKPAVDWKRTLRIFSGSKGRTQIQHTMKRISKRYGTRPGIRIKRLKRLAVIIDTSGSLDEPTLQQFFYEIHSISRSGAQIHIIECDSEVKRGYDFKKKPHIELLGGGGTDYDPAFTYIRTFKGMRFDGCILLTDGFAPEPQINPGCPLLYVITPDGKTGSHLKFGLSIRMNS